MRAAQMFQNLHAVPQRKIQIEQQQIGTRRGGARMNAIEKFHSLTAIPRDVHFACDPGSADRILNQEQIRRIVLNNQNSVRARLPVLTRGW